MAARAKTLRQLYQLSALVEMPIYPLRVAAAYGQVPATTVANWVTGRQYPTSAGNRASAPLIIPADGVGEMLSFVNLTEVHVLSAIRKVHRVPMKKVRECIEEMRNKYSDLHPLANPKMKTNGAALFLDEATHLIDLGRSSQIAIREILEASLRGIVHQGSRPVTIFPWLASPSATGSQNLIAIDPRIAFGRPFLVASGVPTKAVQVRFAAGESKNALARDLGESQPAIDEALRLEQRKKIA